MNADGSGQTNLTNNAAPTIDPPGRPTAPQIAFASDRDGNVEIYVMNANGTGQTRLTNNTAADTRARLVARRHPDRLRAATATATPRSTS